MDKSVTCGAHYSIHHIQYIAFMAKQHMTTFVIGAGTAHKEGVTAIVQRSGSSVHSDHAPQIYDGSKRKIGLINKKRTVKLDDSNPRVTL